MSEMKLIISNNEQVVKLEKAVDDADAHDKYKFNGKEIIAEGENEIKIHKKVIEIVNQFCSHYENTIVLTGAGSSILCDEDLRANSINEDEMECYSGKSMCLLRDCIQAELELLYTYDLNHIAEFVKYPKRLPMDKDFNLEDLLSKVDTAYEFLEKDLDPEFSKTIEHIETMIRRNCTLALCPAHPHKLFIDKLTSRKNSYNRVKIYTTNYDTLFEDAAEDGGFILVDGFSFSKSRKFSSKFFDYDFVERQGNKIPDEPKYISKVVHLMKIHGSIDWMLGEDGNIYKTNSTERTNPLMIYPRRAKFEQSYEKPYFELFSRFQNDLRRSNTILIVIGFSFADKHIRSIVEDAVNNNPGLKVLIVDIDIEKSDYKFFIDRASKFENVMLYSNSFKRFVEDVYVKQVAYSDDLFEGGVHD